MLVATTGGVFDLDGAIVLPEWAVTHVARHAGSWWAVGEAGVVRDGDVVAAAPDWVTLNCVLPTEHTVWVGADSARLLRLEDGSLVEDGLFSRAPGRDKWHTPWGGPPDVRSMTEAADGTVFVNVHVGGILRFDNTGFTPTIDISADVHQVAAHPEIPDLVVAATAHGLAVTANGHDFDFRTDGLTHRYCRAVALGGDTVLVSSSAGPRGGDARLHRGDVAGGPLEVCSGLPAFDGNIDTHCVATRPGLWLVGHGSEVWASTDRGDTWEVALDGLPTITSVG